jgi:hypothetical protein
MTFIYREEKGAPLSFIELDSNFRAVDKASTDLSGSAATAKISEDNAKISEDNAEALRDETQAFRNETEVFRDEAAEITGLNDVADTMALISPGNLRPDVSISFNDGIELQAGYGTRNAHGNKAVDFTRASATGSINKSGASETLGIDEPAITVGGISCYESYDNFFSAPEAPATQVINVAADDYTLWIIGSGSATTIHGVATDGAPLLFTSAGEALTVTIGGAVSLCNLINLNKIAPPVLDAAAPSTVAATVATIPMMGNMPAAGQPFSIVVDCATFTPNSGDAVYYSSDTTSATSGFLLRRQSSGNINAFISNGANTVNLSHAGLDSLPHKIIFSFDGPSISMAVDGVVVDSLAISGVSYDIAENIKLGARGSSSHLNSELKNFEIFFSNGALSSAEITAKGGPK